MDIVEAREEYSRALKAGQKEYKELVAADREPHPSVLDDIMPPENIKTGHQILRPDHRLYRQFSAPFGRRYRICPQVGQSLRRPLVR